MLLSVNRHQSFIFIFLLLCFPFWYGFYINFLFLCDKVLPNLAVWNTGHLFSHSFQGLGSRTWISTCLCPKISLQTNQDVDHEQSSEGSSGEAHVSIGRSQAFTGFWLNLPVLCHVGSFLLLCVRTLRGRKSERGLPQWKLQPFYNLILESTSCHFRCMVFVKSESVRTAHIPGKQITEAREYQEAEITGYYF